MLSNYREVLTETSDTVKEGGGGGGGVFKGLSSLS